jgi:hypothetical protein
MPGRQGCRGPSVRNRPWVESHDAHPNAASEGARKVIPQNPRNPVGDHGPRRFCGRRTLCENRARDHAFAEPANEIHFADGLAESTENGRGSCAGEPVVAAISAKGDEDQKEGSSGPLRAPPLDGQKMPERCLVVSLTSRPTRKSGVAGKGFGHHGFPVAVSLTVLPATATPKREQDFRHCEQRTAAVSEAT